MPEEERHTESAIRARLLVLKPTCAEDQLYRKKKIDQSIPVISVMKNKELMTSTTPILVVFFINVVETEEINGIVEVGSWRVQ